MSMALGRAGFGIDAFSPRSRVHDGGPSCGTGGLAHVLGAEELADFLSGMLGNPRIFRPARHGGGCAEAFDGVCGRTGILYLNNCFKRPGSGLQVGDHIGLFNGRQYYNDIIHPHAGGDETSAGSLFGRADQVRFWPLA